MLGDHMLATAVQVSSGDGSFSMNDIAFDADT
jgi:hypothetical protein